MKKLFGKKTMKYQYMMSMASDSGRLMFLLRELMKSESSDPGMSSRAHTGWIPFPAWSSPDGLRFAWSCWMPPSRCLECEEMMHSPWMSSSSTRV